MNANFAQTGNPLRRRLLVSCASLAIAATALTPQKARAQAFNGTPTTNSGTVSYNRATPGVETITVGSPLASINWSPSDTDGTGRIDFLPYGNTATYQGTGSDYTVLNRIVPTDPSRAIELNGSVLSKIAGGATGGKVWFYSPGGIVVGANATFDVGGLLLSSLDVTSFDASGGTFAAAGGSTPGTVRIETGAQISALAAGSYVALIAPRIEQAGTVQVNGSAAYVAANSLTMSIDQGLFDIAVDVGTDDPNGIVHTGSTTGPANIAASDNHTIYMAAVPKNQALTMLLGGTVGYDAANAGVINGEIVLSSGATQIDDIPDPYTSITILNSDSNIVIDDAHFTSSTVVYAMGEGSVHASAGDVTFDGPLFMSSYYGDLSLIADGKTITANGSMSLYASPVDFNPYLPGDSESRVAGDILVQAANGGAINSQNLTLIATGKGQNNDGTGSAGDGHGGNITISVDADSTITAAAIFADASGIGGTRVSAESGTNVSGGDGFGGFIAINSSGGNITADSVSLTANGTGGDSYGHASSESAWSVGDGYGGWVEVNAASGGSININGDLSGSANGTGGNLLGGDTWAGDGYGGDSYVNTGNPYSTTGSGNVHVTGNTSLTANGAGGSVTGADATGEGGQGDGGSVIVYSWGYGDLDLDGTILASANGVGGNGDVGGSGYGGTAGIGAVVGTVALGGAATVSASGQGGNASRGFGGAGGYGEGGQAYIEANSDPGYPGEVDSTAGTLTGFNATIDASGTGGTGGQGDGIDIAAGSGGDGQGGFYCGGDCAAGGVFALAEVGGASLTLGEVTLASNGTGGAGGAGGDGQDGGAGGAGYGGSAQAGDFDASQFGDGSASVTFGGLRLEANGAGGNGGNAGAGGAASGDGGDAYGGAAYFNARGTATARAIRMYASSIGGAGNVGGDATDGDVSFHAFGGSNVTVTNGLTLGADYLSTATLVGAATGGFGVVQGGTATAGTTSLTIDSGATVQASWAQVMAIAFGGASDSGTGGTANGGDTSVTDAGTLKLGYILAYADAAGGNSISGTGGDAFAGVISLMLDGGTLQGISPTSSLSFAVFTADAVSGSGAVAGNATGGDATLTMTANGGKLATNSFQLTSRGNYIGSSVSGGGDGNGGTVTVDVASALNGGKTATITLGSAYIKADGVGGNGALAGDGTGGSTTVNFGAATTTIGGTAFIGADGIGGNGTTGGGGSGGTTALNFGTGPTTITGVSTISADGTGGAGGNASDGIGGYASGGSVSLTGGTGTLTTGKQLLSADATGGDALNGTGGDADGGDVAFDLFGSATVGSLRMYASAVGGSGNFGGDAVDGSVSLEAHSGSLLTVTNSLQMGENDGVGGAGGAGIAQGGSGSGGTTSLAVDSGATVSASYALVNAVGYGGSSTGGTGGAGYGGDASVTLNGDLKLGSLLIVYGDAMGGNSVTGTGGDAFAGSASLTIDGGNVISRVPTSTINSVVITADAVSGGGGDVAGDATGGDATLTMTANGGRLATNSLQLTGRGNYLGSGVSGVGDGNGGTATVDVASALNGGKTATITLGNAYIAADGFGTTGATGNGTGGVTRVNFGAANTSITGTATISANGAGSSGVGGDVQVTIDPSGSVTFNNAVLTASGTGGSVAVTGDINANSLTANSGGDFTMEGAIVGGAVNLYAGGTANFLGIVSAPTITVTSADIDIAAGASLGAAGVTQLLTLNAMSDGAPVIIGDMPIVGFDALTSSYTLAEEGDIYANAVVINAFSSGQGPAPDIAVYDVNIEGMGSEGGHVSDVTITTGGSILIEGMVDFFNAAAGDSLTLNAGNRIVLNTDTGGLQMTDVNGDFGGTLELIASDVWVADGSLLSQLAENPDFAGRDEALAINNGEIVQDGYLRAGAISASVADSLFVQNSGASDDFAGVTVGDGGFAINSIGEGAAEVTAYGRQVKSNGTVVTGDDFAGTTSVSGSFTSESAINECVISGCAIVVPPPVVPPPVVPPPVVPPPVVPPPVVPPPVVPPPVVPPPVVPPPVVPPQVASSDAILGPLGGTEDPLDLGSTGDQGSDQGDDSDSDDEDDGKGGKKTNVKASVGLINSAPVQINQTIDEPITSGSDGLIGDGPGTN
ncbi:MAG: hypothetical protein ABIO80_02545 [Sphingomicrobium sp.]